MKIFTFEENWVIPWSGFEFSFLFFQGEEAYVPVEVLDRSFPVKPSIIEELWTHIDTAQSRGDMSLQPSHSVELPNWDAVDHLLPSIVPRNAQRVVLLWGRTAGVYMIWEDFLDHRRNFHRPDLALTIVPADLSWMLELNEEGLTIFAKRL